MAIARAFRAIRYDLARAGDLAALTTPPFDVISPEAQRRFDEGDRHNFIQLDFGLVEPGDDESRNRYTRAAGMLADWLASGVLRREAAPSVYVYRQTFTVGGRTLRRTAVLVSLRLADWSEGVVLPHEHTMRGPKEDRLRLTRATRAYLSPIFSLSADRGALGPWLAAGRDAPAEYDFHDESGERHELWVESDPARLAALAALLAPVRLYIADGHHRYETALAYRDERRAARAGAAPDACAAADAASEYLLTAIVPVDDPGLVILPTHRVLTNAAPALASAAGLDADFEVEERTVVGPEALADLWRGTAAAEADLALILPDQRSLHFLRARPGRMAAAAPERSAAGRRLTVAILQTLILERRLGIDADRLAAGDAIVYEQEAAEAARRVWEGAARAAFLVQPTAVGDVLGVADAGEVMPQKSTFFYPKLRSGLVIHPLDG